MGLSATAQSVALQYFSSYPLVRAHKPLTGKRCSATANEVAPAPSPPSARVTVLRRCRCIDCRHWIAEPYSECVHGIIRNGVKPVPEYPADAWHWCALYHGPQISKDVWVWPKATPRAAQVGAGSNIPADPADPTAVNGRRDQSATSDEVIV